MRRHARHLLVVLAGAIAALLAWAVPALAIATPIGQNGSTAPESTVTTILLFVGIPVSVVFIVALIVVPQRAVGALRYRPGRTWAYGREWFGSQPEPVADPTAATTAAFPAGGSSASW